MGRTPSARGMLPDGAPVSRLAKKYSLEEATAWRGWFRDMGALARQMRELLGLSQDHLAVLAHVSQGAISRFEKGKGISTPWIVAVKIRVALAGRLRQLDPHLLTVDARRFLAQTDLLGLPDHPALPPHTEDIALVPAPGLATVVRIYNEMPEVRRAAFVSIMARMAAALAQEG